MRSGSRAGGAAALSPGLWEGPAFPPPFILKHPVASYAATGFWFTSQVLRSKMLSVDLCPDENLLKVLVFRHEPRLPIMPLCSEEYSSMLLILVGYWFQWDKDGVDGNKGKKEG